MHIMLPKFSHHDDYTKGSHPYKHCGWIRLSSADISLLTCIQTNVRRMSPASQETLGACIFIATRPMCIHILLRAIRCFSQVSQQRLTQLEGEGAPALPDLLFLTIHGIL